MNGSRRFSRHGGSTLWLIVLLAMVLPAAAEPVVASAAEKLAAGLNNPRGLGFAANGALFVAESGNGAPADATGSNCTPSPVPTNGLRCYGESGAITRILPWGGFERVITGLPSLGLANLSGEGGVVDISFQGMVGFVTTSWGGDPAGRAALGDRGEAFGKLLRVNPARRLWEVADVAAHESANNPAGGPVDANPYGVLALPGRRIVADAGANALIEVRPGGRTRTFAVLPKIQPGDREPVPTAVAEGPDGVLYVSQLTAFPYFTGSSSILKVSSDGSRIDTFATGLTAVIDLDFDRSGALYVLEIATGQSTPFPPPNPGLGFGTGRLLRQCAAAGSEREVLLTGLTFPGGVAIGPDGAAYVTNFGTSPMGEVLRVDVEPCPRSCPPRHRPKHSRGH